MIKYIFLLSFLFTISLNAQTKKPSTSLTPKEKDSLKSAANKLSAKTKKANIEDYLIVNYKQDTTYVDTSLTITKDYKFNYLRKDNFNLIQFSNIGQTYNTLSYDFLGASTMPSLGANAKHFNYYQINDIKYYRVPTPLTELQFKTAFEQGQLLDAFFTVNTSPNFNFSIAYKGLRSLGKYQHILSSSGNLRFTSNYMSKSKRYQFKTHIVTQDILNQENGGLTPEGVVNFESGVEEFLDRSVFDPNFENAENKLVGKRFYVNQQYNLNRFKDSAKNKLALRNIIRFEDKYFSYDQTSADIDFFGPSFNTVIRDKNTLEDFNTSLEVLFTANKIGKIAIGLNYNNFNYGYDQLVQVNNTVIPNRIRGNNFSVIGDLSSGFGKLKLESELQINVQGDLNGYYFQSQLSYPFDDNLLSVKLNLQSSLPNYNMLLYQSDYIGYNWYNFDDFKNINTRVLSAEFSLKNYFNLFADFTSIDNYAFFSNDSFSTSNINVVPKQYNSTVNYLRIKLFNELKFGKFTLDNTLLYQNVLEDNGILNTPEFIARNSFYFSDNFFKNALFLQTGITFNYFSEYNMNAYNPLLGEFFVQNNEVLGGFPRLDFFINAKVRQTRIFLKAEHFNSAFTGYNYYSAPNYPYRDFSVRFGLVWNFFM